MTGAKKQKSKTLKPNDSVKLLHFYASKHSQLYLTMVSFCARDCLSKFQEFNSFGRRFLFKCCVSPRKKPLKQSKMTTRRKEKREEIVRKHFRWYTISKRFHSVKCGHKRNVDGLNGWNELHSLLMYINFFRILSPKQPTINLLITFCFTLLFFLLCLLHFSSDVIREESIQRAKFLEADNGRERNSKFGDVINLANGKLEMDAGGHFQLVEINENCIKYCLEESIEGHNITAFWSIYKIRHRDEHRGYRYEWKITVRRLRNNRVDGKRSTEHGSNVRSFLMRDQDYPKFFETFVEKKAPKMEKRIFNTLYDKSEHPFALDYRSYSPYGVNQYDRGVENLNTGEYYAKGSAPSARYQLRDNHLVHENNNHVHHHFFLNKDEVPIFKSSHFEKVSTFPAPYTPLTFPNNGIQPSQVSLSRVHNQLDSYGEVLPTTSQSPFLFPDEVKIQEPIHPTTYRGHYDDNRESILDGEVKANNFNHHHHVHHHQNQIVSFPSGHANVIPISGITTTPTSFALNLNTSPPPSVQSFYSNQFANTKSLQTPNHPNPFFWQGRHSDGHQFNFVGSIPYHENTFSELDPIYHGPTSVSTPSHITPSHISEHDAEIHNPDAGFVSQLPLQDVSENNSYDEPTEVHQTTATNTDPSFTTPYNPITTTKAAKVQVEDDRSSYSDSMNKFDSINAQLPPPDSGADLRVPYVETDKSISSVQLNRKKNHNFETKIDNDDASVEQEKFEKIVEKTTKKSPRYKSQKVFSSTERSSWVPKRPRLRSSDKYKTNSELVKNVDKKPGYATRRKIVVRKTTTTTPEPTTVTQEFHSEHGPIATTLTPQLELKLDEQPRTTQSVRKSVSVHIAEKVTVIPKKGAKVVRSNKYGEISQKPRRVAKIKKVEKSVEDSTESYLEQ